MQGGSQLPALGDTLGGGKYRVVRQVGTGGMGAVFEGVNLDTTRRVALKVLRPELAARTSVVRRFAQEARAASRIEHPNIIVVFDLVQDGERVFIVEEFLDGEDVKQHVAAQGPMSPVAALRLVIPVMEALVHAHACGVVHRDVKPDNVFLARTARGTMAKVIDFGIARVFDDDGESLQGTAIGEVVGTTAYMSPEQARGDVASVDARTDVWSTGALLYFAVTGARPFEGQNRNQMLHRIINDRPEPLETRRPGLPAEFTALVYGALENDLTRRTPTMTALLAQARACLTLLEDRTEVMRIVLPRAHADEQTLHDIPERLDVSVVEASAVVSEVSPGPAPVERSDAAPPEATPASWEDASLVMQKPPTRWLAVAAVVVAVGVVGVLVARWTAAPSPSPAAAPAALVAAAPSPVLPVVPDAAVPSVAAPTVATPTAPEPDGSHRRRGGRAPVVRGRTIPLAPNPYGPEPPRQGLLPDPWGHRP
jgi:serine/threonine-protein kinase